MTVVDVRRCARVGCTRAVRQAGPRRRIAKFCSTEHRNAFYEERRDRGEPRPAWCRACNGLKDREAFYCAKCRASGRAQDDKRLRSTYNLTILQYDALLAAQGGTCAARTCDRVPTCVDHDHACCPARTSCGNCVRGLLCRWHNLSIGNSFDSPNDLRALADYLERAAA